MDDPALDLAVNLALSTGILLKDYFNSTELEASLKSDYSLVTNADRDADQFIRGRLSEIYPEDIVITEESFVGFPTGTDLAVGNAWIVDPLDGTTNFALGLHYWGILITRLVKGWPDIGVMYFPMIDELYTASRDSGARLNNEPFRVPTPKSRSPVSFFACCSRTFRQYQVSIPYKVRILGSAAYTICMVAHGAAIVGFEAAPKIWDIAGGWLLINEAGGVIDTFDGSPLFPLNPCINYKETSIPILCAATSDLYTRNRSKLQLKTEMV